MAQLTTLIITVNMLMPKEDCEGKGGDKRIASHPVSCLLMLLPFEKYTFSPYPLVAYHNTISRM